MSTETEQFWAGDFGEQYLQRNHVDWEKKVPFYKQILAITKARSVLELGCNAAWNLRALYKANQNIELSGCDINELAIDQARKSLPMADIEYCRAIDLAQKYANYGWTFDLVMTAGVLIHIPPEEIREVMQQIVEVSNEYVLAIEYTADKEEEVLYRGHDGKLWRRPYGQMYKELGLSIILGKALGEADGFGPGCMAWLLRKA